MADKRIEFCAGRCAFFSIASEQTADALAEEATRQKITVTRVPENELLVFIGEARDGFKERFGSEAQ